MDWVRFNPDKTDIETFVRERAPSITLRKDHPWIYVRSTRRSQTKEFNEREEDEDKDDNKDEVQDEHEDTVEDEDEHKAKGIDEDEHEHEDENKDGDTFEDEFEDECEDEFEDDVNQDMDGTVYEGSKLEQDWEALCKPGRWCKPVTHQKLCELAKAHGCTSGKWLLYEPPGDKLDKVWADIARATVQGNLGSAAKVSTRHIDNKSQVICVYNEDFTDRESVLNLEKGLRRLGIGNHLGYKPDIYTYLGIYAKKDKWGIKPTICSSKYDLVKKQWNVQFTNEAVEKGQTKLTQYYKTVSSPTTSHQSQSDDVHPSSQRQKQYPRPQKRKRNHSGSASADVPPELAAHADAKRRRRPPLLPSFDCKPALTCRHCGRSVKARIGLISHERACAGRPAPVT